MPSRLRYLIIRPNGSRLGGAAALELIRALPSAARNLRPNVNWDAINLEGTKRGYWTHLAVWRERRGIQNHQSTYHSDMARRHSHPAGIRGDRAVAAARRHNAERARIQLSMRRTPTTLLREDGPRPIRPGIFA